MDAQDSAQKDLHGINLDIIGLVSILNWFIDFFPLDNFLNIFTSGGLILAVTHFHTDRARRIGIRGMLISTLLGLIPFLEWIPAEFITRHLIKKAIHEEASQ